MKLRPTGRRRKLRDFAARAAPPGAPPGSAVAAPEGAAPTQIDITIYSEQLIDTRANIDVSQIPAIESGKVLWVHVAGLGAPDIIQQIGARFHLHPLLMEDIFSTNGRPKAESYGEILFLQARLPPTSCGGALDIVSIIVGPNFLISIDEHPGDCFEPVRTRLNRSGPIRSQGADYLMYALIDSAVDGYFPVLEAEGALLDNLEEAIRNPRTGPPLNAVHAIKRRLLALRRVLWPMREVLNSLTRDGLHQVSDSTRLYLRDTQDHVVELIDLVELYRETAKEMAELSLSMVSARMNEVMRFLTIISTIFMPLTFIVGIYGMNFDRSSPFNMPELGWRYGYVIVLSVMALVTLGFLQFFRKRDLLHQPSDISDS